MRRTSLLLIGAGAGLLVVLFVLLQAVQSTSRAATPTGVTGTANDAEPPAPHAAAPVATHRPGSPAPSRAFGAPAAARAPVGSEARIPAPPPDPEAPPATRGNTKNLHFGGTQLRAQTAAVEPLVVKCVEADVAAGRSPTGKAALTYIVARHGDRVTVEQTGVDEDHTTLEGAELLECLHRTSLSMKFEGLPREAEGLVVTRSVTVDRGKLTENKHVGFSYLR